ncbi:Chondroitin sulfate synthase 3 [Gracilariopsis chorda]|uniref:Chondroitin sulfate synthase 3 n=1 Tax=Gracilariopsis chorda TaxID=448386 RepID=A0A2V3J6M6_9FLOR|nr:Chondroitin sulfate synthase 3 [Gracilariopsis chorda]|eukprot:PXF49030.1 Chondroitin sulfate synthase 3 [Gracilariopsis chorda]
MITPFSHLTTAQLDRFFAASLPPVANPSAAFADRPALSSVRAQYRQQPFVVSDNVSDSFFAKCYVASQRAVFHPSLCRVPDEKELHARLDAKQPRDYDDIFATVDQRRFLYHPDRTAVRTVDELGADLDTDYDNVRTVAIAVTEHDLRSSLIVSDTPVVYMRNTRQHGFQAIVNVRASFNHTGRISNVTRVVTVTKGFGRPCEVHFVRPRDLVPIHIVLPYSNRPRRLAAFLSMLDTYFRATRSDFLHIIICTTEQEKAFVIAKGRKHKQLTSARLTVISSKGDAKNSFSRAVAVRDAAKNVPRDEIMFVSDVDMRMRGEVFENCRTNTMKGSQVWFPVMFSLYPYGKSLSSRDGMWRRSSYGMACMYRSDFDKVGGFGGHEERRFQGWGSEDVILYNQFRDNPDYAVLRALEPGLLHQWHSKECVRNKHYKDCMRTVYMTIGSQEAVAELMADAKVDYSRLTKGALPL